MYLQRISKCTNLTPNIPTFLSHFHYLWKIVSKSASQWSQKLLSVNQYRIYSNSSQPSIVLDSNVPWLLLELF